MHSKRRKFIKQSFATAAGIASASLPAGLLAKSFHRTSRPAYVKATTPKPPKQNESIRFSVIGLNHGHIYGQVEALRNGGGELMAVYAKEPESLRGFTRRYPDAKVASSEDEILEDSTIQMIASASIASERAPLGIRAMKNGKDFMVDKPGITTLEQLAEVKKVQQDTKRIYSIMYSERLRNPATVKAGELVKAGAIGKVVQTIGMGPHRMRPESRPDCG